MDQVASIYRDIQEQNICGPKGEQIRIEMFCHGALCMAVSGKCYLSLNNFGASANRGACVQLCRRGYIVKDKESELELEIDNQYIMSPKDLKTIHFLNKMLDAGVRVLKIEGRARGAEYVKTVVECYKEAVQLWEKNAAQLDEQTPNSTEVLENSWEEKIADWDTRLARVFNRGFWDGYYQGQKLGEWTHKYGSRATRKKVFAGKCTNFFKNISVAEFYLEATKEIRVGDELLITGETTGAYETVAEEIHNAKGEVVEVVEKGNYFAIKTDKIVRRGDRIFLLKVEED
jgi:putative protease